ncbi:mycobacterium membrane protein [Mycobacterium sp. JS623]|uniref:MmpS family transport accessory protein n=1 Tax=Mycobacterium sp. JS623 TaxID=212767 RepID=UPI0002A554D6|nr:MmpS family transport accessory protein [Mycobacterium sp. JS623]AGB24644.1 mycobacterium membrane protein [Mycobacterium sp. JS623]
MTDSPRRDGPEPFGSSYPGYTDPAYASQAPYGPTYQAPAVPAPTEQLPAYSPYGYDPYATGQYGAGGQPPHPPEPEGPKSPRWLWIVAGVSILTVIGLVIALVIVNSSKQETVVAPLPSLPEPTSTRPTPTTPRPTIPVFPLPTLPSIPSTTGPSTPATPGATETVAYNVSGDGRAINITYVDTGGVLQTEFNVMLPWSKEVQLSQPAKDSASVSIINVGREVSCSISVNGVQVQQRTGAGLTICTAAG